MRLNFTFERKMSKIGAFWNNTLNLRRNSDAANLDIWFNLDNEAN